MRPIVVSYPLLATPLLAWAVYSLAARLERLAEQKLPPAFPQEQGEHRDDRVAQGSLHFRQNYHRVPPHWLPEKDGCAWVLAKESLDFVAIAVAQHECC